ncbi:MAG: tetratricopeptide repeat protein [Candidatus Zixiibacteriota bacterium]|jgi:tetratricopeptide (TPR) repeat protein
MASRFKDWLSRNRWPVGIATATLLTRGVYLITVSHDPFFTYLRHIPDAFLFNNWAQEILSTGDWLGGDSVFYIGPLYAYFLAIIYRLTGGPHLVIVRIIQMVMEAGSALFIFGFARRVFSERVGRIAGIGWVLYLPAIFFCAFLLPVSLDCFLLTASFYLLARGTKGKWWTMAGAGALLGVAALDRGNLLIFVAAAVPVFIIYIKKIGWRRALAYYAAFASLVAIVTVRNGVVGGDFVPISSQGGLNFYIGNSEEANGVYWNLGSVYQGRPTELNRDLATAVAEEAEGRELKPSQVQRYWFRRSFDWIRENPGDVATLYWRKLRFAINDYEVSLNVDFYFMKFVTPFHRFQFPWFGLVFPFAVIGLVTGWRKSSFPRTTGAVFAASYLVSLLIFFVSARYRFPLVPMLLAFGAAGAAKWYDLWRAWRWKPAALVTAAVIAIGAFTMYPPPNATRVSAFGQSYYRYGKYYFDDGDYNKAVYYFSRSTALAPEFYQGFTMLAASYEKLGQYDTALDTFWQGTLVAPENPMMHFNFGVALGKAGRYPQAIAALTKALELNPEYTDAVVQLTEVYIALGDYGRAAMCSRRLTELAPEDATAWKRHAELLYQTGRHGDAMAAASRAIELDPAMPGPGAMIGRIYYESGDYGEAIRFFEREAELQPRSNEVYAFLATLYGKVGRAADARAAYRNYLNFGGRPDPTFERDMGMAAP